MKQSLLQNLLWTLALAVAAVTGVSLAWGGTYNFYFTNTEQGANSTATPSVTVHDGKATSEGGQAFNVQDGKVVPIKPSDASGAAPVSSTQQNPAATADAEPEFRHLRLGFGYGALTHHSDWYNEPRNMIMGEIGFAFTREIGINVFGGPTTGGYADGQWAGGAELEITPIRASLFRMNDFLALSALGGANTFQNLFFMTGIRPHFGARADLNLGHQFGVSGALRQTIGGSGDGDNFMASVGLIIRI